MSVDRCECGETLGTQTQLGLLPDTPAKCITCVTKDRIRHILAMLPQDDERFFERLNSWERSFITSVRLQFERKGSLSELQLEKLEQVYERTR